MLDYKKINFGLSSAESERAEYPELIEKGYWDCNGSLDSALNKRHFLFRGYKGVGKSILSEKIDSLINCDKIVTTIRLSDFPYKTFKSIISGSAEPQSRYPMAWSWLLLLKIIESFKNDNGTNSVDDSTFVKTVSELKKFGLIDGGSLTQLVTISTKNSFKAQIPGLVEILAEEHLSGVDLQFSHLVAHLNKTVINFRSHNQHILIIDGLDDILTGSDTRYDSLGALMGEVLLLNILFSKNDCPAKIIILCRTELFERLSNPNKNKIRQDYSINLEWYDNTREPTESELVKLANHRAKLSQPEITDIFSDFFPLTIDDKDCVDFLLRQTRHTPRDFLQLLTKIAKFSVSGEKLTRNQILNGLREYSYEYFLPEIKDELNGYFKISEIDDIFKLIGSLAKRTFNFEDLGQNSDLQRILNALFECSAIGNSTHNGKANERFSFKFRNKNSTLRLNEPIILHSGLWKALNLI